MSNTADVLKKIIARKHEENKERSSRIRMSELRSAISLVPPARGFVQAMRDSLADGRSAVIAEIKKASPSKGVIRENFNPAEIAQSYQQGGATCLSILTDQDYFQGHTHYLQVARAATSLPVIRKDFIVDSYQLYEAKMMRADCVLLIVAALEKQKLKELNQEAIELGLDVLVEVHNEEELKVALELPNTLIGINNRNLHNFEVDLATTYRLQENIPNDKIIVTESGIKNAEDVKQMRDHGINSFLVGESFMREEQPGAKLKELFF